MFLGWLLYCGKHPCSCLTLLTSLPLLAFLLLSVSLLLIASPLLLAIPAFAGTVSGVPTGAVISCCSAVANVPAIAGASPDACIPAAVKRSVVLMLLSTLLLPILADAGSQHGFPAIVSLQLLAYLLLLTSIPLLASLLTLAHLLLQSCLRLPRC